MIARNTKTEARIYKKTMSYKKQEYITSYLMIGMGLLGFLVFILYPNIWALSKSLYYYSGINSQTRFVGMENFLSAFTKDATYWKAWITTIKFTVMKLPIELPLALLLAVFLTKKLKGNGFFRALYYMPCVISVAIVGVIFTNLFDYFGFINAWLLKLHIISEEIDWFGNSSTALWALVIGSVWNSFGVNVVYFISALSNVPEDIYEAAALDGASKPVMFFKMTLPMIAPVLQTILLLSITATLKVGDYILVTTNGAPGGDTHTVMSYMVSKFVPGFAGGSVNIGYGCALSLITSIILALVALGYSKLSEKMQNIY